jgi:DNA processing protein
MNDPVGWIWMQSVFGIATRRAHDALERFRTPEALLALSDREIADDPRFTDSEKRALTARNLADARHQFDVADSLGWTALTPSDPRYPERLSVIHSAPLVLWAKGDLSLLQNPYPVTIVGSREPDAYGRRVARKISAEVTLCGGVVVSGFARGIDSVAHESAIAVGGKTIAVLACGPDGDYPKHSADFRREIEENGLLLTEFPIGFPVKGAVFHIRNRLLSGLSLATVVAQAAHRSGALITAGHALAQDRDLYAVCGDMFSLKMAGCHELLLEGASPIFSGVDLLRRYEEIYRIPLRLLCPEKMIPALSDPVELREDEEAAEIAPPKAKTPPVSPREKKPPASAAPLPALSEKQERVYRACAGEIAFDDLCERADLPAGELLSVLTQLEIFGLVESLPGRRYRSARL